MRAGEAANLEAAREFQRLKQNLGLAGDSASWAATSGAEAAPAQGRRASAAAQAVAAWLVAGLPSGGAAPAALVAALGGADAWAVLSPPPSAAAGLGGAGKRGGGAEVPPTSTGGQAHQRTSALDSAYFALKAQVLNGMADAAGRQPAGHPSSPAPAAPAMPPAPAHWPAAAGARAGEGAAAMGGAGGVPGVVSAAFGQVDGRPCGGGAGGEQGVIGDEELRRHLQALHGRALSLQQRMEGFGAVGLGGEAGWA